MSLNQKYTWNDFLKEHPEHKAKKTKRTSSEGKKAYEAAYKAFVKKYLIERAAKLTRDVDRAAKRRDTYVLKLKELRKTKKRSKAKLMQKKVGRFDSAISSLKKQQEKNKAKQKDF